MRKFLILLTFVLFAIPVLADDQLIPEPLDQALKEYQDFGAAKDIDPGNHIIWKLYILFAVTPNNAYYHVPEYYIAGLTPQSKNFVVLPMNNLHNFFVEIPKVGDVVAVEGRITEHITPLLYHGNTSTKIYALKLYPENACKLPPEPGGATSMSPEVSEGMVNGWKAYDAKDYTQAMQCYQKAATQGNAVAEIMIGLMYEKGQGVTQDYQEAMKWYQKAATQGNSLAENDIGYLYEKGNGVTQSYQDAMQWYQKAATQGNPQAENNIGYLYEKGNGVTQNYQEAMQWYQKAAAQGNSHAENNMGYLYEKGNGVTQDDMEAMKWYQKAAAQGNPQAENNIGVLYGNGRGVTQDYQEAMNWYRKAAEHGNAMAEKNIGHYYEKGKGVSQDYREAMKWYQQSLKHGYAPAQKFIDELSKLMAK